MPTSLTLPLDDETVRSLHVGDEVLFSGRMITAREAAHRVLLRELDPTVKRLVEGRFIYHCGPVVAEDPATHAWRFAAAGPSSSLREEPYQAEVIARYGVRGVVGKGGMGPATLAALAAHGAVYLHAVGALAVGLARRVVRVHGVHKLDELGVREAIWDIEVKDFPAIVTMDAHGESLHARLEREAEAARALLERTSL
ncbi:fumarate hydratase C-terminal domain-containing protein [Anaeromyxobacter terrae]|uniref:fumarate hydratase C-terminal domain-containing protein n=1 Tax=Anaeromyxobacter terrae TaxID=2925406 RepID=UPI001F55E0F0|nr:fumarate hydratase C-terminal domain-containing protein [Anaeromyxobacter sp. SG22]